MGNMSSLALTPPLHYLLDNLFMMLLYLHPVCLGISCSTADWGHMQLPRCPLDLTHPPPTPCMPFAGSYLPTVCETFPTVYD